MRNETEMEREMQETITRRIDFCDVDLTGVMWHGNYCRYYEDARCQLLKKLGFSYQEIYNRNYQIPLVHLEIKYSRPCHFDQEIAITAELVKADHFLVIKYVIKDKETGKTMSEAETKHAFYDSQKKRALINVPEFIAEKLKKLGN